MLRPAAALLAAFALFAFQTPKADAAAPAPAAASTGGQSAPRPEAARAAFDTLVNQLTTEWFEANPESATQWGVTQAVAGGPFNGHLNKAGLAARAESAALVK